MDYFSGESLRNDLKGKTVRGGLVTGLSQAASISISFASIPVLARLLDPADFGLVAMVTFFTGFAAMFVNAGLSMATVQSEEISRQQVSNLFWIATFLGAAVAGVVAVASPAISWLYTEPRLTAITLALSCSFILSGLTIQHQALLQRGMQFSHLAIVTVFSQVAGVVTAIGWAWWQYQQAIDYWALVLMPLVAAFSRMALTWNLCSWRPSRPQRGAGTRKLIEFGANLTGANFVNYFARNADNMLIGWWWGATQLGFYAQAYKLLLWPLQQIMAPLSSVAVPALSRLRNNPDGYRRYFRAGVSLASMVLVPVVLGSLVMAEDLVLVVFGPGWQESVPIFLALGPAAIMATTAPGSYWVFSSWGHSDTLLKLTIVNSLLIVVGFAVSAPFGPLWVAATFSAVTCVIRLPNLYFAFRPTPLRMLDLLGPMFAPLSAAIAACTAVLALAATLGGPQERVERLLINVVLFLVVYIAVLLAFAPQRKQLKRFIFGIMDTLGKRSAVRGVE